MPESLLSSEDLRENFGRNPDIRSARSNLDYTRMLYAIAKRENSLTVQLQGTYRIWTDYTYHYSDVEEGEWDLLLYVEVPISDGGKKKANIRKNRNLLEEAEKRLEAVEENVRAEYRKARAEWEGASANVFGAATSEGIYRGESQRYLGPSIRNAWRTCCLSWMPLEKDEEAKTQLLDAQLNMYLARAKLRQQKGSYLAEIAAREPERTKAFEEEEDHAPARKQADF